MAQRNLFWGRVISSPPLTDALDPAKPHSLVSLPLADLPVEIIGTPALRRLTLVKTLGGEHGVVTEVQQFREANGTGIRSVASTICEFDVPAEEAAVLHVLEEAAAFDVASRRLALSPIFRDNPERSKLLNESAALRFDPETQKATEGLTQKYTQALFANVFEDCQAGVQSIADLVARLNQASSDPDPAQRKRVQTHIIYLQQRFQLGDVTDILPFFSDFELLVTAIAYYRQNFLALVPHMRRLEADIPALSQQQQNPLILTMLARVGRHLRQTALWIELFFQTFDASFDDILSGAEPQTFKALQESLQKAYAAIGRLLCGWGLRLQAMQAGTERKRQPPSEVTRINMIRELVCKHLNEDELRPRDLDDAIGFLRQAARR